MRLIILLLMMIGSLSAQVVQVNPLPPSATAVGGDIHGTVGSVTVAAINGSTLGSTTPTAGNLLIGGGSSWVTQALTGALTITSGGVTSLAGGDTTRHQIGIGTVDSPTWTGEILTGGTVSANAPLINGTQTWNNAGVTFTGALLNVTNTASGASSKLIDLQVAGSSKFNVDPTGQLTLATGETLGSIYLFAQGFTGYSGNGNLAIYRSSSGGTYPFTGANMILSEGTQNGDYVFASGSSTTTVANITRGGMINMSPTITATAAGTTTLTNASSGVQIFTGSTTQTVQLPAANLFSANISVHFMLINRSTGTVSWQRAGTDNINGATSNVAIPTLTTQDIYSDGVANWYTR